MNEAPSLIDFARAYLVFGSDIGKFVSLGLMGDEYCFAEARLMIARMRIDRPRPTFTYRRMVEKYCCDAAVKLDHWQRDAVVKSLKDKFPTYDFSW